MIRMTSLPVGQNYHSRPLLADYARDFQPILKRVLNTSVGNVKRLPPRHAEYLRSFFSLSRAVFRGAARSHFSLGQIEYASPASALGHLQQCAAAGLFDIVAVGRDCQNIQWRIGSGKIGYFSQGFPVPELRFRARSNDAPPFLSAWVRRDSRVHLYLQK